MTTSSIEDHQWMPTGRLRQYAIARAIGGVLFGSIFVGWMLIMWHEPVMRFVAMALLCVTCMVTYRSIRYDLIASAGRQITLKNRTLEIVSPDIDGQVSFELSQVGRAVWRHDNDVSAGLWFFDERGEVLVHLDINYVGEEAEARVFIGWLRRQTDVPFDVEWNPTVPQNVAGD